MRDAFRMVATATAQVLRLVADVIDPEPAYGYPRQARADVDAADATWPSAPAAGGVWATFEDGGIRWSGLVLGHG